MPEALATLQDQSFETGIKDAPLAGFAGMGLLPWLTGVGSLIAPWWSYKRDMDLRRFVQMSDHLSGALYAMISKVTTIPFAVLPRDKTIDIHVQQADERTQNLLEASDYFRGWNVMLSKFLYDYYTQDNGAFLQIIGSGDPATPIIGWPFGLAHLDASKCLRTRNPEFPVIYTDLHGNRYQVHYTRIIEMSSMPSTDQRMNGVGISAISRCVNVAQNLIDIATYEQEKMGSRPPRLFLVGSQISGNQILEAFNSANIQMNEAQLARFAKIIAVGNPNRDIKIERIDLASVPDGFNKDESTKLGIAAIALAFGVDFRELWPATVTGATKSDAEMSHMKAKGKWAEVLQRFQRLINHKFLPPQLEFKFDHRDEEDNQLKATVEFTKAQSAEKNIANGILTPRVIRERWLDDGVVSEAQFEEMELSDGRLADGTDILNLFLSDDVQVQDMLRLSLANPLDVTSNDPAAAMKAIDAQLQVVNGININASRYITKKITRQAIAALKTLRDEYDEKATAKQEQIRQEQQNAGNNNQVEQQVGQQAATKPGTSPANTPGKVGSTNGSRSAQSNGGVGAEARVQG